MHSSARHPTDVLIDAIHATQSHLPKTVGSIRTILQAYGLPPNRAWLIGTQGCHLCEQVHKEYAWLSQRHDLPLLSVVDIMDFDDKMMAIFAQYIPVLIANQVLVYPFGWLDMMQLDTKFER